MKKIHYDWVDYAKGIGVLLVVYGHVTRGMYNAKIISTEILYKLVDSIIYSFHMPLFFFLSGLFFVSSLKKRGIKGLMTVKIYVLVYPYFIWSIIQLLIKYSLGGVTNSIVKLNDFYSIIWLPVEHFWFLYSLFLIFLVYSLIHTFTKNILFTSLLSIVFFISQDFLSTPWWVFNSIFQYGVFFCGGMLAVNFIKPPNKIGVYALIGCLVFSIIQWFYHSDLPIVYELDDTKLVMFVAFVSIVCLVIIALFFNKLNVKFIKYIGQFSLEIYLAHIIFASGFRIVSQKLFGFDSVFFHLVCGTLVGVIGPILLVKIANKMYFSFLFYCPHKLKYSSEK